MSSTFRFQRFAIDDNRCGMKIGTDAVLLGAWTDVKNCARILDIGTGCGIIALMLAQRTEGKNIEIDAIEIDPLATETAAKNVAESPWPNSIDVIGQSLSNWTVSSQPGNYTLCVCNPPFFHSSTPAKNPQTRIAKHQTSMTMECLFRASHSLLSNSGQLSLVIPFAESTYVENISRESGFSLLRKTMVRPLPDREYNRLLLQFGKQGNSVPFVTELSIEVARHQFSPEYEELTRQFHLRFAKKS